MKNVKFIFVCLCIFTCFFPLLDRIVEKIHSYEERIPSILLYVSGYAFSVGITAISLLVVKNKTKDIIKTFLMMCILIALGFCSSMVILGSGWEFVGIIICSVSPGFLMVGHLVPYKEPTQPFKQVVGIIISLALSPVLFEIPLYLFAYFSKGSTVDFWSFVVEYFLFFVFICSVSIGIRFAYFKFQK